MKNLNTKLKETLEKTSNCTSRPKEAAKSAASRGQIVKNTSFVSTCKSVGFKKFLTSAHALVKTGCS